MVVIDTAGRVLEIAHLLDQLWSNAEAGLMTYNLVMLSHVASSVVEFAKSQVEWMSDKILKSFETGRYNPFAFRHVQLCHSHLELTRVRSPKVVLCSGIDMESGFSRELFLEWCSDTRNTVYSNVYMSLYGYIHSLCNYLNVDILNRRVRLEGSELEQYKKKKQEKEQEAARLRLEANRRNARMVAESSDDDSDDEEALANAVAAVTGFCVVPGHHFLNKVGRHFLYFHTLRRKLRYVTLSYHGLMLVSLDDGQLSMEITRRQRSQWRYYCFIFLGRSKLLHFRPSFQEACYISTLVNSGIASIRRNEAGRFHVEGCASAKYYKIRDIIYNQFAIVVTYITRKTYNGVRE
uniref:Cleavage and polyadenylation specificity factor subunit 2 n=1 Tax=Heterorhabditis bacteriophora TaxID=37862 RepID=A0A1I7XJ10_HETBA